MRDRYLFRAVPDPNLFPEQHRAFVNGIDQNVIAVHYLSDLVADHEVFDQTRWNPNQVYTRDALITVPEEVHCWLHGLAHS